MNDFKYYRKIGDRVNRLFNKIEQYLTLRRIYTNCYNILPTSPIQTEEK